MGQGFVCLKSVLNFLGKLKLQIKCEIESFIVGFASPNAQPQAVFREFMARSTGSLRDWLESLEEYRQLQFMQSPIGTALNIIHNNSSVKKQHQPMQTERGIIR